MSLVKDGLTLHDGRFVFHNLVGAERLLLHSSLPPINGILEFYQTFPSRLSPYSLSPYQPN